MRYSVCVGAFAVFLCSSAPGSAQETETAALGPVIADQPAVISNCEKVASDHSIADAVNGICVGAARTFLDALKLETGPGSDQRIADMVVAVVPMSQDDICDEFDREVAQLARVSSESVSTPEQAESLLSIAQTIESCEPELTSAIDSVSPA